MNDFLDKIGVNRLLAFLLKEFRQTFRNRLLLYLLLVPPTVQLIILGAALDPELHHMRLGICDQSATASSRALSDSIENSGVFDVKSTEKNSDIMAKLLEQGKISAMVVIPKEFDQTMNIDREARIQTLVDGADAYTAGVADADLHQIFAKYAPAGYGEKPKSLLKNQTMVLYNPGLKASWYIVPGILGSVITLVGTLVSSAVLLREREQGTLEQLLMTPAAAWEIIFAKIAPLFLLLMGDVIAALVLSYIFFGLPMKGNPLVFFLGVSFYICNCIGAGILLGTFCKSQRQAQLCSFFLNIPLIQLSGSVVPFESMPEFMQNLSRLDPLRYFSLFARASLLKGAGFDLLWPYLLILAFCAACILSISTARFRRQLG
jgi:ABC-2 type transport system permease protein